MSVLLVALAAASAAGLECPAPCGCEGDCTGRGLKQLGRSGALCRGLRALDLSRNAFRTVLEGAFGGCGGLERLSMAHGHVKWIEEHAFDGLTRLQELHLHHNQLSALLPEWFSELRSLRELRLDNNQLAFVNGGSFAGLSSLRSLGLSGNRIRGFGERALEGLESLESLRAQDNALVRVPRLEGLQELVEARFGGNPLRVLRKGDFEGLPHLETVAAEGCPVLEEVEGGAFSDLPRLRAAHLHGCPKLRFVAPDAFVRAPGLRVLSLHGCALEALSERLTRAFAQPPQLSLRGNPLRCDCNARWLQNASELLEADSLRCADGALLRGLAPLPAACAPCVAAPANHSLTLSVGEPLHLRCLAHGLPAPHVHWEAPSGALPPSALLSLHRVSLADAGPYLCVAENPLGRSASQVILAVHALDIHLFALSATPSSITLVWNGTARNAFPEYRLVYSSGSLPPRSTAVGQFLRSYTVGQLRPGTPYSFCLAAEGTTLSCTDASTSAEAVVVWRTSNVAVAVVAAVIASMSGVVCAAVAAARKFRHRLYDTKSLAIPLESLRSPLVAR